MFGAFTPEDLKVWEVKGEEGDLGDDALCTDLSASHRVFWTILKFEGNVIVKLDQEARPLVELVHVRNLLQESPTLETFEQITCRDCLPFDCYLVTEHVVADCELHRDHPEACIVQEHRSHA